DAWGRRTIVMTSRLGLHPALSWPFRVALGLWRRGRFAWRFVSLVRRFDKLEREDITLWSPPGLLTNEEREQYLSSCQTSLHGLAVWFDVPPIRPLTVVVFA